MITFKLEDKEAETLVAMLNATGSHASFIEALNEQYASQTAPVAVVEEPLVAKKTKAAAPVEGDK